MPDLSSEAVKEFWSAYEDPMIYRVVSFMEGVEPWALDGDPALEEQMALLGNELDDIASVELGKEDKLIRLCCHLKTSRALRLLQSIDTAQPGAASKLLIHAEEVTHSEEDNYGIFLRRNIVFERLRLLARIFSPERIAMVLQSLEEDEL